MFCSNCGAQMPDGTAFCSSCGARMQPSAAQTFTDAANQAFSYAEREVGSAVNDMRNAFNGQSYGGGGHPLKTDRGLLSYIVLTIVTCGIYAYYFIYSVAQDVNTACEGDNENTGGLVAYILLSIVTCGIYSLIWEYKLGNRLAANAPRYGMSFQENGTTVLLWHLFGSMLCGVGPFIAMHIIIKNTNAVCAAYNATHGFYA